MTTYILFLPFHLSSDQIISRNMTPKAFNEFPLTLTESVSIFLLAISPDSEIPPSINLHLPPTPIRINNNPTSLMQNAHTRTNVPRPTPGLPVSTQPARSPATKVQRRRPKATQRMHHGAILGHQRLKRRRLDVQIV